MSTLVEIDNLRIVIDPSVSSAPNRFGLPPHPVEMEAKEALWKRIKEHVTQSDILVVTHYHFDHFNTDEPEIYQGKKVLLKHPKRMINRGQRNRAVKFLTLLKEESVDIEYADGRSFKFRDTEVQFSGPVPHGSTAQRGYVIEVCVRAGGVFLHTSDVQGPLLDERARTLMDRLHILDIQKYNLSSGMRTRTW
jgi:predicted metallo-beta-lactamase superfamily hydrolase